MLRRVLLLALFTVMVPAGVASRSHAAVVFSGSCAMTFTINFTDRVNLTTSAAVVSSVSGAGANGSQSCATGVTTNPPYNIPKGVTLSGDGDSDVPADPASCQAIVADGPYDPLGFSPDPVPPSSTGTWLFAGDVGGGTLVLTGTTGSGGTLAAVGTLALDPLTPSNVGQVESCATTTAGAGMTSITYRGTLAFVDP